MANGLGMSDAQYATCIIALRRLTGWQTAVIAMLWILIISCLPETPVTAFLGRQRHHD
jgi:hypothetical protein